MKTREETNAYQRARYQRLKAEGRTTRKRTDYQREYKRRWREARKTAKESNH